jgi:cell division protein FtsI (penicillin-binding protein 3)
VLEKLQRRRVGGIALMGLVVWCGLGYRLWTIQVARSAEFRDEAQRQHERRVEIAADRGSILDRRGEPLAVVLETESVYAIPSRVPNVNELASYMARLGLADYSQVVAAFAGDDEIVWLARRVPLWVRDELEKIDLEGVYLRRERRRCYSRGSLAGNLLGFVGVDDTGLEGIEYEYDSLLRGTSGFAILQKDANGRTYPLPEYPQEFPEPGYSLLLTLDLRCQQIAEEELAHGVASSGAVSGSVIVLDPMTGEIVALANQPEYDPNRRGQGSPDEWRNRAVTDLFEPGSTFKLVAAGAALEAGLLAPEDSVDIGEGKLEIQGHTITDALPRTGHLSLSRIVSLSSNVGIIHVARLVGPEGLYLTARAFGFGAKTDAGLPGEGRGLLSRPDGWDEIHFANLALGQGVSVTALQMASAYAAVANGGVLMRPFIVKQVLGPDGRPVDTTAPQSVRRVVSPEVARLLTEMLIGVVDEGTGAKARVDGVSVAGKTGTGQQTAPGGGYSESDVVASFIGYVPAESPRLVLGITIDRPQRDRWGGQCAARVFQKIVERILQVPAYRLEMMAHREAAHPRSYVETTAVARTSLTPIPVERLEGCAVMPDVMGQTARSARQELLRVGLEVKMSGSGIVVRQEPAAGARVERGDRCLIECESREHADLS